MDKIAKAVGAAQGGATSAMAVVAAAAGFVQLLPADTHVPWWGYILFIVLAMILCMGPPFVGAYLAPANSPPVVGDTIPATTPAKVVAQPAGTQMTADATTTGPAASG